MTDPRRRPVAVRLDNPSVAVEEVKPLTTEEPPRPAPAPRRRWSWSGIVFSALGILLSLAIGLAIDQLVRDLFARHDWLGWFGAGIVAVLVVALLALAIREFTALLRLRSIDALRDKAQAAVDNDDATAARAVLADLNRLYAANPETARGRNALAAHSDEVIDGRDLILLAERDVMAPLDAKAQRLVTDAAKRVSLVTAISPRAIVDILFAGAQSLRLIRQLSALYGGRPGLLGFLALTRHVIAHLAVTGGIAVGDGLLQQVLGHGLATRISARLGEGVINGLLTARVGLAAMDMCRPLPFLEIDRPGINEILSTLISSAEKAEADNPRPKRTRDKAAS